MLDTTGKLLERMIATRVNDFLDANNGIADNQYGFRRGVSTIDAIKAVLAVAENAGKGAVQRQKLCVLITLDVQNAFNSARWEVIEKAMIGK